MIKLIFIFALSLLGYIFVGYPLILALLAACFGKAVEKADIAPSVTLLISAYNEEAVIKEKLENSLKLDYPRDKLEIVVASESTDGTNAIVKAYADRGAILYHYDKREGKRATLFRTVPKVKGEIIVFSDANAMYQPDAIKKLVRNFADERIGCVSGRLRYKSKDNSIGEGESAYWEYDFVLKSLASRLFVLSGGVNGSILAIRKALYNPIDKYRGDDFEIANRIELAGYGVVLESEALSFEEASEASRQEFSRKVRLVTWNLKSTLLLLSEAMQKRKPLTFFLLLSHRLLRYAMPIWLIALFVSNAFLPGMLFRTLFVLQVIFYGFGLLGFLIERRRYKAPALLLLPFYFCMVNCAALIGVMKNIFGKTEMVWEKVR